MKLFETKFGSQVYGTVTPDSDVDIGVVALESPLHIFGLQDATDFPQVQNDQGEDIRRFWLKRFMRLCVRGNPNVLEWLYTPENDILYCHPLFRVHIIENAHYFIDIDKIVQSHLGFAKSQAMKMRQYGYDVKYASHAIRLIYQLTDLLESGRIVLPYEDEVCAELLAIKTGDVSLAEFDALYEDRVAKVTHLIDVGQPMFKLWKPNHDLIASILEAMYRSGWAL